MMIKFLFTIIPYYLNFFCLDFLFQDDVNSQKVAFLLHKQWTLYSLTPLYKFSYAYLKEYSRLLSAFIAAEKQRGLAVEVGNDFSIRVVFSTLPEMKGTQRDSEAFLIPKKLADSWYKSWYWQGSQDSQDQVQLHITESLNNSELNKIRVLPHKKGAWR